MIPRKRLDIGFRDLGYALAACLMPKSRRAAALDAEALWSPDGGALLTLSVRSGFDLLLRALALPAGSEILVSAVTIRDMIRIVEKHGLVAVPVDMDMDTLSVRIDALEAAWSPRTRAILVAHLFGSRAPLDEVAGFARRRDLLLIEDCAQGFTDPEDRGHPGSDVTLFSFGPIKSNTALGGGIVGVRDLETRGRMRAIQRAYPVLSRTWFFARALKYMVVTLILTPVGMETLAVVARAFRTTHDELMSRALRGFPGPDLFHLIRRQAPFPLIALLRRRLTHFRPTHITERAERGRMAARLMPWLPRPGRAAVSHSHWVFPSWPRDPDGLMRYLWTQGFDATRGASSLAAVRPAPERPEIAAPEATAAMARTLFLPVYPEVSLSRMNALSRAVEEFMRATAIEHRPETVENERPATAEKDRHSSVKPVAATRLVGSHGADRG